MNKRSPAPEVSIVLQATVPLQFMGNQIKYCNDITIEVEALDLEGHLGGQSPYILLKLPSLSFGQDDIDLNKSVGDRVTLDTKPRFWVKSIMVQATIDWT